MTSTPALTNKDAPAIVFGVAMCLLRTLNDHPKALKLWTDTVPVLIKLGQHTPAPSPTLFARTLSVLQGLGPKLLDTTAALTLFTAATAMNHQKINAFTRYAYNLAADFFKSKKKDGIDHLSNNVHDLQKYNEQAAPLPENYKKIAQLLSLLFTHYSPLLKKAEEVTENSHQALTDYEEKTQELVVVHEKINIHEVNAALYSFMSVFSLILATHGQSILLYPSVLQSLKDAGNRVQKAELRLQDTKKELQETVQEIQELEQQILEADLQEDPEFKELQDHLRNLGKRNLPNPSINQGISDGIPIPS